MMTFVEYVERYERETGTNVRFQNWKKCFFDSDIGFFFYHPDGDALNVYESCGNARALLAVANEIAKTYHCTKLRTQTKRNPIAYCRMMGGKVTAYEIEREVK